jgi:hypothetical protein
MPADGSNEVKEHQPSIHTPKPENSDHSQPTIRSILMSSALNHSPLKIWRLSYSRPSISAQKIISRHGHKSVGQMKSVLASGIQIFTLKSLGITSLKGFGVHPEIKRIYIQQNFISSFEGWECQPALEELNVDDNIIENFRYCVMKHDFP